MFNFSGKLEHLLHPSDYYSNSVYKEELEKVFAKSWIPACLASDLSEAGSRFACEIAGAPVVILRDADGLKAYSNVCGHRHSLICPVGKGTGHRMRCQIHGWEYNSKGQLAKIPDGKHFKVVKPGDFSLKRYQVESFGPFVFVNLQPDATGVEGYFGSFAPDYLKWFEDVRLLSVWEHEHDVNWKIPVENSVESYHVPVIHPNTFEDFRDESLHDHLLEDSFTRYRDLLPYEKKPGFISRAMKEYTRLLLINPTYERFTHTHVFPNIVLYYGDIYRNLTLIEPLSETRFRYRCFQFVPTKIRYGAIGRMIQDLSMVVFVRMVKKIIGEDAALWSQVQKGVMASSHRGVLSAREERVYAFQEYMCKKLERAFTETANSRQGPEYLNP
jgi:choline monooxygenase